MVKNVGICRMKGLGENDRLDEKEGREENESD